MLKLNSTGGKLDITLTDDALFGTSRKPPIKQATQRGTRATSRAANAQGKPPSKKTAVRHAVKTPKDRNSQDAKTTKKVPVSKQNKPSSRQVKQVPKQQDELKVPSKGGSSQGTGVITQAKLESILSMLNNSQVSGAATSLSPEQVSALVTSFSKINANEQQQVPSDLPVQNDNGAAIKSTNAGSYQDHEARTENIAKLNSEVQNTTDYGKQLDELGASKRKAKELQKQKEAVEEYNPWGRPGAGAPIRSQSGKVLADYHSRTAKEPMETSRQDDVTMATRQVQALPSQTRPAPVATVATATSNVETSLPVALRSSFAVGAPGLVSNETQQKRQQELKWKQELEKQIEEKKERDRQRKLKEDREDFLNLSWGNKQTRQPQTSTPSHVISNSQVMPELQQKTFAPQESHVEKPSLPLNQSLNESFNRNPHARGFGMHTMDPQSQDEAEKKRLKMLEHQRAIQEQVEENRRKKQQEREQRMKEEAIEEARLAKEREKMNQAFEIERKRKMEKEEEAKRLSDALQQSVLDAYQAAQLAKREKRQKHLEAGGHSVRGGGTSSRSYVISRTSSRAHHSGIHDNTIQSPGRQSIASNYTTPRPTERNTLKNKSRASRAGQAEPPVPPLNLVRGISPPVPTLRNKLPQNIQPTSHRSVTPTSGKGSYFQRTVSTNSEPSGGSMALSTHQEIIHRNQLENILQSDLPTARYQQNENPIDTLEDAFMIPYHRTDSATLPDPVDTHEDNTAQEKTVKPKGNNTRKKNATKQSPVSTIPPMYRSETTHLKTGETSTQDAPRRTKGTKGTKPAGQPGLSPRGAVKKSLKANSSRVSQPKPTKHTADNNKTKKMSPRIEAALSRLSGRQDVHENVATARQEMILQQLAALRQGLILKERELKQELHP